MPYFLSDSLRAVLCGSDLVILDLNTNQYNVLNSEATIALQAILSLGKEKNPTELQQQRSSSTPNNSQNLQIWIENFLNAKLIKNECQTGEDTLARPLKEGGLKDYTWVLQNNRSDANNFFKFDFCKSIMALIITNRILQKQGIKGVINLLQKQASQTKKWETPKIDSLNNLMLALDRACQYYPRKVVCLAWASTFAYLCLKRGWFVQFVIGVQLHPFLAHAWVEREGEVIGDREDINSYLGVLLREPQRS
jgi:hypothetical protein